MNKTLLIIGAGVESCEGIKIARSMGLYTIVADGDPDAPGFELADYRLNVSTYDARLMATSAYELTRSGIAIDGVIAMCADVPLTVAIVAKKLLLPGLSIESAEWVSDKLLMKERLRKKGIPIPRFKRIYSTTAFDSLVSEFDKPFVIKPVDSRGARGVQLIESEGQYSGAYKLARRESPTGRVMVEQYLAGPQISTETLVDRGVCYTLGFSDRNYQRLHHTRPFIIEDGGDAPSHLSSAEKKDVTEIAEKAALALGLNTGVAKGDMVMTADGARVIEVAGRLSGGYFSTTQILLATGVDFIKNAVLLALGENLDPAQLVATEKKGVAIRYLWPPAGKIKSISGLERARKQSGVEMLSLTIKPGDTILPVSDHTQRAGFVIATGTDKLHAIKRAADALNSISIEYAR